MAGLLLGWMTPPGHSPDEYNHLCRADSLLHGAWIGHREMLDGHIASGGPCNSGLRLIMQLAPRPTDPTPEPYTASMAAAARGIAWAPAPVFLDQGSIGGYMPAPYVPGALAIAAVRLAGGSPLQALWAVRAFNLTCFIALGALALALTRRGAALMACTLLLPMTLSLAASCSQDGLLIAGATLGCAALTRVEAARGRHWFVVACVCFALVIAGKAPYAPLALLLFLPQSRRRQATVGVCVAVVLPAVAWVALEVHSAAVMPLRAPMLTGPLWPGPPMMFSGPNLAAQLRVLLAHPLAALTLPLQPFRDAPAQMVRQMVGVLDFLSIELPARLIALWLAALAASAIFDTAGRPRGFRPTDSLLPLLVVWLSISAIGVALYLQWTPVGMPWVGGVEGRYLLPLLPALALGLPRGAGCGARRVLLVVPALAGLSDVTWLPWIVSRFFRAL